MNEKRDLLTEEDVVHELKTHPCFFVDLVTNSKPFEIRKDDRGFKVGHKLRLREWDPNTEDYTGREVGRVIIYITAFKQEPGWVVMGIRG